MNITKYVMTEEEIESAIIAILRRTGDQPVLWTTVRSLVPGEFWKTGAAVHRLHDQGRVYLTKCAGRPYVCLGDDADAASAALAAAEGRPRPVRVM